MEKIKQLRHIAFLVLLAGLATGIFAQEAQQMSVDQRVAALKKSLMEDQVHLKQYQWIETTAVSFKGEEKSRTQNSCSYGVDGKVQKTPVGPPPETKEKRGLRGKIIENKKEEMSEYMQQAVALVKFYVPPDPAKFRQARTRAKPRCTIEPSVPGWNFATLLSGWRRAGCRDRSDDESPPRFAGFHLLEKPRTW
jgi:hypothetical protein